MNILDLNARDAKAVTPSDTVAINPSTIALYIGTGGNIRVVTVKDFAHGVDIGLSNDNMDTVDFNNVPDGFILNLQVALVKATGTTASNIVAFIV